MGTTGDICWCPSAGGQSPLYIKHLLAAMILTEIPEVKKWWCRQSTLKENLESSESAVVPVTFLTSVTTDLISDLIILAQSLRKDTGHGGVV